MSGGILVARDLEKRFFQPGWGWLGGKKLDVQALRGVSLSLVEGETLALVGESGCGKTTLAKTLGLLLPPDGGSIQFEGEPLESGAGRSALAPFRRRIQMIFQDPYGSLNPRLTAGEIIAEPLIIHHLGNARERQEKIEEAAGWVGLDKSDLGRYPHQFSGGQRQRIMVARALLLDPRIIVADEPVSMVDASLRATILESLYQIHRERGISLVYITHDLTTAYQLCTTILVMYRGDVVEVGDVERVMKEPVHPYTQLLVRSIPHPDPKRRWGEGEGKATEAVAGEDGEGCVFAGRCPHVMAACRQSRPPLLRIDSNRAAACYLHEEAEPLSDEQVAALSHGEA